VIHVINPISHVIITVSKRENTFPMLLVINVISLVLVTISPRETPFPMLQTITESPNVKTTIRKFHPAMAVRIAVPPFSGVFVAAGPLEGAVAANWTRRHDVAEWGFAGTGGGGGGGGGGGRDWTLEKPTHDAVTHGLELLSVLSLVCLNNEPIPRNSDHSIPHWIMIVVGGLAFEKRKGMLEEEEEEEVLSRTLHPSHFIARRRDELPVHREG
jgi:hypothetical protein